jgi:hypothetical protein
MIRLLWVIFVLLLVTGAWLALTTECVQIGTAECPICRLQRESKTTILGQKRLSYITNDFYFWYISNVETSHLHTWILRAAKGKNAIGKRIVSYNVGNHPFWNIDPDIEREFLSANFANPEIVKITHSLTNDAFSEIVLHTIYNLKETNLIPIRTYLQDRH